jgi:hypothetical protein
VIAIRDAVELAHDVEHTAARLTRIEHARLVRSALMIHEIRLLTLDRDHWAKIMQILGDLAPSLANEFTHLLDIVDKIHQRIPNRPRNGNPA